MLKIVTPESPIKLEGFPTCASGDRDGREVEKKGDFCRLHGGEPASLEIIRRAMHGQIITGLRMILACEACREIPPNEIRCKRCAWLRGAIMGIAGIGEQVWGDEEFGPYIAIVSVYDPGWQNRVQWK